MVLGNEHFFGPWDEENDMIDELELTTILIALQILPVLHPKAHIRVFCDNTVAISYILHMGGKKRRLHSIAQEIWDLLESYDAFLVSTYVASAENVADQFTRGFSKDEK